MCDRGCGKVLKGSKLDKVFSNQQAPVLQNSWMTVATSEDRINTHKTDCSRHHTPETQPSAELSGLPTLRSSLGGREPAHLGMQ